MEELTRIHDILQKYIDASKSSIVALKSLEDKGNWQTRSWDASCCWHRTTKPSSWFYFNSFKVMIEATIIHSFNFLCPLPLSIFASFHISLFWVINTTHDHSKFGTPLVTSTKFIIVAGLPNIVQIIQWNENKQILII